MRERERERERERTQCSTNKSTPSTDDAAEVKASVFEEVLRPRFRPDSNKRKAIQIEIHVALSPSKIKASILLNKLRLIGIFDLIMELKSFVFDKIPESDREDEGV